MDTNGDVVLNSSERTNFQIDRGLLVFGGLEIQNIALLDSWKAAGVKKKRGIGKGGRMEVNGFFSERPNDWNARRCDRRFYMRESEVSRLLMVKVC